MVAEMLAKPGRNAGETWQLSGESLKELSFLLLLFFCSSMISCSVFCLLILPFLFFTGHWIVFPFLKALIETSCLLFSLFDIFMTS
jgi:hypothetical protein